MTADTILLGRVFTADLLRPWADAVAVRDGLITAVGSTDEVLANRGDNTVVVESNGLICPSFHDAHIHLLEGSWFDLGVNLHDTDPVHYVSTIEDAAGRLPATSWVRGGGWSMAAFPDGNPDRLVLDRAVAGRPAYLTARDGHTAWVSSAALALAGITDSTSDPPGGRIERDAHGHPTGALHETAMKLVAAQLPPITDAEWAAALELGQRFLHSLGITAWQDARLSTPMLQAYLDAEARGLLSARVAAALHWDPDRGTEQIEDLTAARARADGPLVSAPMVKVFVDGVVENRTAALLEPYRCSHSHAAPLLGGDGLLAAVTTCVEAGFAIHVHAIGDAATTWALDALAAVRPRSAALGLRHQICHLQLLTAADAVRFADLDVIANIQALWACRDEQNVTLCLPLLGTERFEAQYPFGELLRAGARLAFGSDWRVSTPNPLPQMEVAVTRRPPGDTDTAPLGPRHQLDLATCIRGFTSGAAYAAGLDHHTGSLTVGRSADIVVLDRDPFTVPAHELSTVTVNSTMFGGAVVYDAVD